MSPAAFLDAASAWALSPGVNRSRPITGPPGAGQMRVDPAIGPLGPRPASATARRPDGHIWSDDGHAVAGLALSALSALRQRPALVDSRRDQHQAGDAEPPVSTTGQDAGTRRRGLSHVASVVSHHPGDTDESGVA